MIDAKTLTYVTFTVIISVLTGFYFGWKYSKTTKIAEFYVVKNKTSIQKPVSGFSCECFNDGAGNLIWLGGNANCNSKIGTAPMNISSTLRTTPGGCCQGTGRKNSPVINDKLIYPTLDKDPCL